MKRAKEANKSRVAGAAEADATAAETAPACASATRVVTIAATMPTGLAAASAVKMAGYLDKRGKRLPTWKQYWFVLDGRLLLYFRSQFEYLHQLSPCRGSLNLGLVNDVKPTGSSRATCPQLVISTRSQAMLLRAKDRATQERWLQALLDALQPNVSTESRNSGGNHFRYSSASLPQVQAGQKGDKDTKMKENSVEEQATSDLCLPKPVLRSGHTSQKDMIKELRVVGKTSLRHIDNAKTNTTPVSKRKNEIVAQLPTSTAVSKLLEKRMEETEVENHVTTIILDNSKEHQEHAVNTVADTADIKKKELHHNNEINNELALQHKSNEKYLDLAMSADEQVDSASEKISEKSSNSVNSTLPRSREAIAEVNATETEKKVKRKKSFLGRILDRKSKDDSQEMDQSISLPINHAILDSQTRNENDANQIQRQKVELNECSNVLDPEIVPNTSVDNNSNGDPGIKEEDQVLSDEKSKNQKPCDMEQEDLTKSEQLKVTYTEQKSEIKQNPIVTTEILTSNCSEGEVMLINESNPKITHIETPISSINDRNHEDERLVLHKTIININGYDTSEAVINSHRFEDSSTGVDSEHAISLENIYESEDVLVRNSKSKSNTNKPSATKLQIYTKNRDSYKYRSVDELDILLHQLTNITFSPLHNCVSMNDLPPLRKSRPGSEPDYDIPRPHNIFVTCSNQGIDDRESTLIHSTSFFGNSESYKSQKRLSEYLLELNRMSQIADKRCSRAVSAQNKWLKLSKQQTTTFSNDEFDVVSEEENTSSNNKPPKIVNENSDLVEAVSEEMPEEMKKKKESEWDEIYSEQRTSLASPAVDFKEIEVTNLKPESEISANTTVLDTFEKTNKEIGLLEDKIHSSLDSEICENLNLMQTVESNSIGDDCIPTKIENCQNYEDDSIKCADFESEINGIQSIIDQNNSLENLQTFQDIEDQSTIVQETDRVMNDKQQNKELSENELAEKITENTITDIDGDFIPVNDVSPNGIDDLSSQTINTPTTETFIDTEDSNVTQTGNVSDANEDESNISEKLGVIKVAIECEIICNEENLIEENTLQILGNCSQQETVNPESQNETNGQIVPEEENVTDGKFLIAGDEGTEKCTLREKKSDSNSTARLSFAFADSELVLQETVNNLKCEVDAESLLSLTP